MSELGLSGSATTHTLRHTAVTYLKEMGFSAAAVDRFLGKMCAKDQRATQFTTIPMVRRKISCCRGVGEDALKFNFGAKNK